MDRAAALMNDPAKTDYTYAAQLAYLNMAIDELVELLEESNASPTNQTSVAITVPAGTTKLTPFEHADLPHYPSDLVEIQEIGERMAGSNDSYIRMARREFVSEFPRANSLMYWVWENQIIKFNPAGAFGAREIELRYVGQAIAQATDENSIIGTINARSYLSYKTAALLSQFIGENESRAQLLNGEAELAVERMASIDNKGRQQMSTRHRPFRASYKARGGF